MERTPLIAFIQAVTGSRVMYQYLLASRGPAGRAAGVILLVIGLIGVALTARFAPDIMSNGSRGNRRPPGIAVIFMAAISVGATLGGARIAFKKRGAGPS